MESGVGKNHSGGTIFVLDQRGVLFPLQIDFLFWTGTPRDNETNIKNYSFIFSLYLLFHILIPSMYEESPYIIQVESPKQKQNYYGETSLRTLQLQDGLSDGF